MAIGVGRFGGRYVDDRVSLCVGWQVKMKAIVRFRFGSLAAAVVVVSMFVGASPGGAQSNARLSSRTLGSDLVPYGYTMLASLSHSVWEYSAPGVITKHVVRADYFGSPLVMPVISVRDGYLQVRLPYRPNSRTAWVKQSSVGVSATPYRIKIYLRTQHLELFYKGFRTLRAPVGIGTTTNPTPSGRFFVLFFSIPPNGGYGPFDLVTSAHSNTITDWESSGDALIGIHGPLGADGMIGNSGARISHGCIRMHLVDQRRLDRVTIGTPIEIIGFH